MAKTVKTGDIVSLIKEETADNQFIFYTLSGAHLYGFPSADSDYDIRGCHIITAKEVCGLKEPEYFMEKMDGDFDFVSFDIKKELNLLLKNNSNVLGHIFAKPLIAEPEFKELRIIAEKALSRKIYEPYHGLAKHNWMKYIVGRHSESEKSTVKKYLYVLRSQMAGIYVLEHGRIEPDICVLNRYFGYPIVDELISLKRSGSETELLRSAKEADSLISKLWGELDTSKENSSLPENPSEEAYEMANEFLLRCRGFI